MRRKNLKILRVEQDLTQIDMAKRIGCNRAAYGAIEAGTRDPSFEFMEKLQAAFNIPAERMWGLMEREK